MDREERIPTIFKNKKTRHVIKHPTRREVDAVFQQMQSKTDLSWELKQVHVDLRELSRLIALNLYYKELWESALEKKEKAIRIDKETDKGKRGKRPSKIMETVARKAFAKDLWSQVGGGAKHRPYLDRLYFDLYKMFSEKSDKPYRYIAAIFTLFGFHAENFREKYCKLGCGRFKDGKCVLERIFLCPKHEAVRNKSVQAIKKIAGLIPSTIYPRRPAPPDEDGEGKPFV
jgi:hypothetical protein